MVINTNYSALSSSRQLGESQGLLNRSLAVKVTRLFRL